MSHRQLSYHLKVVADADPTLLSRVCGALTTLSIIPLNLQSRLDIDTNRVALEMVVVDASDRQVDLLQRKLVQMVQVESVLMKNTEKRL